MWTGDHETDMIVFRDALVMARRRRGKHGSGIDSSAVHAAPHLGGGLYNMTFLNSSKLILVASVAVGD